MSRNRDRPQDFNIPANSITTWASKWIPEMSHNVETSYRQVVFTQVFTMSLSPQVITHSPVTCRSTLTTLFFSFKLHCQTASQTLTWYVAVWCSNRCYSFHTSVVSIGAVGRRRRLSPVVQLILCSIRCQFRFKKVEAVLTLFLR